MFDSPVFWTGFFTLLASMGTVWLKDHLDRKKEYKHTIKQKAIQAYTLANRLIHTNNVKEIICSNLLQNANYNSEYMLKNNPDTTYEDLQKLELLIVENFFNLNDDFLMLNKIIVNEAFILWGIISNPSFKEIRREEFEQDKKKYQDNVITTSSNLRKKLIDQYINRTKPLINIYDVSSLLKKIIKNFFKKPAE